MRIDNPDQLPYYIIESGHAVQVRFAPLSVEDKAHLKEMWSGSVYAAVWQHLVEYEVTRRSTLKLVSRDDRDERIFGLLCIGTDVAVRALPGGVHMPSVLETAPQLRYQHEEAQREISGTGRVLVARLIAESVQRGHGGALIVSPRPQAIRFYRHLGFEPLNRDPKLFFIREEAAQQLLQDAVTRRGEN